MEIAVAPEGAFAVSPSFSAGEARGRFSDAASGETVTAPHFGVKVPEAVELATFAPADAEPARRASAVDRLDLYFLPVHAFGLVWTAKGKTVEVSCDGATGEVGAP